MSRPHCQTRSKNHPAQAQKLAEGVKRNAAWQGLATKDKLHVLARRRGASKRQVAKLGKAL